ncbi:hypothetical protein ACGF1Z_11245 [Streptomyces sp. NPDC048018]|uniref:hypothetical protein n=1 Tax=Streptomyces sp. NPDC048018 TaxID=3365499 RepID=UPI003721F1DE
MQRPNAAQYAYGSATVVFSTVALLLLSGTTTTLGIAAICVAGLMLGVLVAVTMPVRPEHVKPLGTNPAPAGNAETAGAPRDAAHTEVRVPAARVGAGADTRTGL